MQKEGGFESAIEQLAVFDVLANNADRKSGHCLKGNDGRLWAIDHGICFHAEPKLRTVLWDYAGKPLRPVVSRSIAFQLTPRPGSTAHPPSCERMTSSRVPSVDRLSTTIISAFGATGLDRTRSSRV
jgi:hypothetical protein